MGTKWVHAVQESLMESLKAKDAYTYSHSLRVAQYAENLSKAAGYPQDVQRVTWYAGLFHDLGKIGIPDAILKKPSKLTSEEYEAMKRHPEISVKILEPLRNVFSDTFPTVLHHHEQIDGKGYPHQLVGENIPITARILLIADTFDAVTSLRPYHLPESAEVAFQKLTGAAGKQFDKKLVEIFIQSRPVVIS